MEKKMILKFLFFFFAFLVFFWFCETASYDDVVLTVDGPIPISDMGTCLIHEHILVDFIGADRTGYHRWNREEVVKKVLPYLREVKNKGVNTILECTPAYLGRDPRMMKILADKSGINILSNTGFYGAVNDKYIPDFAFNINADSMAALWINEFKNGIEDTGIKPGFIKIAVDPDSVLTDIDKKIVHAAIITHKQTGLTIVSHTGPDGPAFAQLKMIKEQGLSASSWVWTHAQEGTPEAHIRAAKEGAWISIDNINQEKLSSNMLFIKNMKSANMLNRLLISHDAGWYDPDQPKGGEVRGYTDIFTHLVPLMLEEEFTQDEVDQILVKNPKNAFQIKVRIVK
jgi:phosphotriesterase-related protein